MKLNFDVDEFLEKKSILHDLIFKAVLIRVQKIMWNVEKQFVKHTTAITLYLFLVFCTNTRTLEIQTGFKSMTRRFHRWNG